MDRERRLGGSRCRQARRARISADERARIKRAVVLFPSGGRSGSGGRVGAYPRRSARAFGSRGSRPRRGAGRRRGRRDARASPRRARGRRESSECREVRRARSDAREPPRRTARTPCSRAGRVRASTRPSRVPEDARGARWGRGDRCDRVCAREASVARERRSPTGAVTSTGGWDFFSRSSGASYPAMGRRARARAALTRRAPHLAPTTSRHTAAVTPTRHTPRPTLTLPPHGMALCLPGRASPVTAAAARHSRLAQRRSTMASPAALVAGRRRLGAAACAAWSHAASRAYPLRVAASSADDARRAVRTRAVADVADATAEVRTGGYPFADIEARWQKHWADNKTFRTPEQIDTSKPKFYALDMFPYPRCAAVRRARPRSDRPPHPSSRPNPNPQSPRPVLLLAPSPFAAARVSTWAIPRATPPPTSSRGISA
jgi:hypothetical protein